MKFKGTVAAFADYVQYYIGFQVTKVFFEKNRNPELYNTFPMYVHFTNWKLIVSVSWGHKL
jgi:hypothetical protein